MLPSAAALASGHGVCTTAQFKPLLLSKLPLPVYASRWPALVTVCASKLPSSRV
jgi:hypothetical protein